MSGKLISYDFDGVCHAYTSKWISAVVVSDPPVRGAFEHIKQILDAGYRVAVFSSRSNQPGGIEAMRAWFKRHGMPEAYLTRIEFPTEKPAAHLSIDDRAYHFQGLFPSLDQIRDFTPWNKKPSASRLQILTARLLGRRFPCVEEVWELRDGDPFRYLAVVDTEIAAQGEEVKQGYEKLAAEGLLVGVVRSSSFTRPQEANAYCLYRR